MPRSPFAAERLTCAPCVLSLRRAPCVLSLQVLTFLFDLDFKTLVPNTAFKALAFQQLLSKKLLREKANPEICLAF